MDQERFLEACRAAAERKRGGIGTMGEKGIHNALKHYYEPDESCHEVPVGGFVADIVGEDGIIEIQSTSFAKLREKLDCFLTAARVTVVWPCVVNKRIITIDPQTCEALQSRRSPKKGSIYGILRELWWIKDMLDRERLSIVAALVEADEYRPKGYVRDRRHKGGSSEIERLPTAFLGEVRFDCPQDYRQLLPEGLPERFTARELGAAAGLRRGQESWGVGVLTRVGVICEDGRMGRAKAYCRALAAQSPEKPGDET